MPRSWIVSYLVSTLLGAAACNQGHGSGGAMSASGTGTSEPNGTSPGDTTSGYNDETEGGGSSSGGATVSGGPPDGSTSGSSSTTSPGGSGGGMVTSVGTDGGPPDPWICSDYFGGACGICLTEFCSPEVEACEAEGEECCCVASWLYSSNDDPKDKSSAACGTPASAAAKAVRACQLANCDGLTSCPGQ
jgi:hypothetical protein